MNIRERYKAKAQDLQKRANEALNESGKKNIPSIYLVDKLPKGIGFYNPKEGEKKIDILPLLIGENFPEKGYEKGTFTAYRLRVYVHKRIGIMDESFVCPYHTFGKPCPICEDLRQNRRSKEEWKELKEQERHIMLIWAHEDKEEAKGVQIWDVAAYYVAEELREQAITDDDGGALPFWDIDDGYTLRFKLEKGESYTRPDGTKGQNVEFKGFQFRKRKNPIPDEILEQANFCLDECIKMHPTYEEIKEAYEGKLERKREQANVTTQTKTQTEEKRFERDKENKCPGGGEFGKSTNRLGECEDCPIFDDCYAMKKRARRELDEEKDEEKKNKNIDDINDDFPTTNDEETPFDEPKNNEKLVEPQTERKRLRRDV